MLQQCDNCPKYNVPEYDWSCSIVYPKIKFHLYVLFSTCSLRGFVGEGSLICNLCVNEKLNSKIRSKKILIQRELTIGNFMYDVFLPSLEKYIYHVYYVQILLKNHCENFDRMLATLNLEIYYR